MSEVKNWKEKWGWSDSLKYLRTELKKRTKGPIWVLKAIDAGLCLVLYGSSFHDYINLRFYMRSAAERKTFITTELVKKEKKTWDKDATRRIDNKLEFNKLFKDKIGREWLDIDECEFPAFKEFLQRHNDFFVKPKRESSGIGVRRCNASLIEEPKVFFDDIKEKGVLVEEKVTLCEEMRKLNPNSISQIRVVTICDLAGDIHILTAALRSGGATTSFNIAKDDIYAQIELESGVVITNGLDETATIHENHPISGIKFIGFQIPEWSSVLSMCTEAAKQVPEVRVIGWDVAVTDDGCIFFEGNPGSGVASMQMADGIGKKELFYKYLNMGHKSKS